MLTTELVRASLDARLRLREAPTPVLAEVTDARGFALAPRLTVHPRFVARYRTAIDPNKVVTAHRGRE